jgi:hypothetical protein
MSRSGRKDITLAAAYCTCNKWRGALPLLPRAPRLFWPILRCTASELGPLKFIRVCPRVATHGSLEKWQTFDRLLLNAPDGPHGIRNGLRLTLNCLPVIQSSRRELNSVFRISAWGSASFMGVAIARSRAFICAAYRRSTLPLRLSIRFGRVALDRPPTGSSH